MIRTLMVMVFLAGGLGVASAKCDPGETAIRFGAVVKEEASIRKRAVSTLKAAVDKEFQGKACLQVLQDDGLYADGVSVTAVQAGNIDMAAPGFSALAGQFPEFQAFGMPFAFRNSASVETFFALSKNIFADSLKKSGLKEFGLWHGSFKQISASRPVYGPDDVAGMKFRFEEAASRADLPSYLKATSTTISENDLSLAIKQGRVDALISNWAQLNEDRTALLMKGVTQTNHHFEGFQIVASQTWWNGLDPKIAKPLSELVVRISRQINFETQRQSSNARRAIMRGGVPVRILTRKQREQWREVVAPVWDRFENVQLKALIERANLGL